MVNLTGLNFMERDNNRLEKADMFFSQWDSEARYNRSQDVQQFSDAIELKFVID